MSVGPSRSPLGRVLERKLAGALFNRTWDLLTQQRRTREDDQELLRTAFASAYHWYRVGNARNFSIAEWQLARVYAALRRPEPAVVHAERSLRYAKRAHLAPFYVAYGHEGLARAYSISGAARPRDSHLREARRLASKVRDREARRALEADLATIR